MPRLILVIIKSVFYPPRASNFLTSHSVILKTDCIGAKLEKLMKPLSSQNDYAKNISMLKKDVSQLKKNVSKLKKDVAKLKVDVAQIKKDILELKTRVTALNLDLARVENKIEELGSRTALIPKLYDNVDKILGEVIDTRQERPFHT